MIHQPSWLVAAGDLLLGATCAGCAQPGVGLCARCRAALSSRTATMTRPTPCPEGFPLTAASSPYDTTMQRLITAHKEHQALVLAPVLAARLETAILALLISRPSGCTRLILVPVPSAAGVVRGRGYDATAALAAKASRRLCTAGRSATVLRLLRPSRSVRDQAGLSAQQRQQNLSGAMVASTRRRWVRITDDSAIVIVDDVVTTGASLTEAARALGSVGIEVHGAAVVAATVRRHKPGGSVR